jgi:hypothetical protein
MASEMHCMVHTNEILYVYPANKGLILSANLVMKLRSSGLIISLNKARTVSAQGQVVHSDAARRLTILLYGGREQCGQGVVHGTAVFVDQTQSRFVGLDQVRSLLTLGVFDLRV